jgi:hypothetical protein
MNDVIELVEVGDVGELVLSPSMSFGTAALVVAVQTGVGAGIGALVASKTGGKPAKGAMIGGAVNAGVSLVGVLLSSMASSSK